MKKYLPLFAIIFCSAILPGCGSMYVTQTADVNGPVAVTVTYQRFYDELSPYGRWVDYPGYGYVWSPSETGFRPYYTNGYWGNTNMGWSWVSDYSWGWGPFHYGRWFYEAGYGWLWLPGYEWAPAWVSWRNQESYYGWAPLAPGMDLNFAGNINIPAEHWAFVEHAYLHDKNFRDHCIDEHQNEMIYHNSALINNTSYTNNRVKYAKGPDVKEVAAFSGKQIKPAVIREHTEPGRTSFDTDKREMHIYKPSVIPQKPQEVVKPKQVTPYKDLPHDNGHRGTWSTPAPAPSGGDNRKRKG